MTDVTVIFDVPVVRVTLGQTRTDDGVQWVSYNVRCLKIIAPRERTKGRNIVRRRNAVYLVAIKYTYFCQIAGMAVTGHNYEVFRSSFSK